MNDFNDGRIEEITYLDHIKRLSGSISQLSFDNWKEDALEKLMTALDIAVDNADVTIVNNNVNNIQVYSEAKVRVFIC